MPDDSIQYYNRYTGKVETEAIYGERPLRMAYQNPVGRGLLELIIKRGIFSRWYGWRMNRPGSRNRVAPFLARYGLDASEFAAAPESYTSFNDFFYRKLREGARPIDANPNSVVFPADGRHLGFQDISQVDAIFVKGQRFDVRTLLGDAALAEKFQHGTAIMSRLCPVDYHRFHFVAAGIPGEPRLINGPLYSVNPIALRRRISYLWENKRVITLLKTDGFGDAALIEIGATNVGSINQTFKPGEPAAKGDEKGYFAFGGSSTVTLFEPGKIQLAADLLRESAQRRELYARMGDSMGVAAGTRNE